LGAFGFGVVFGAVFGTALEVFGCAFLAVLAFLSKSFLISSGTSFQVESTFLYDNNNNYNNYKIL